MKIAYKGFFLGEGLRALGHELYELPHTGSLEWKRHVTPGTDLVVLELYGSRQFPGALKDLSCETVVYGIDSPINEFWLKYSTPQADHVFFDQKATVERLSTSLKSAWLPLCALEDWFVPPEEKEIDVCFVGTVNKERLKRASLLNYLGRKYSLHIASGISVPQAQSLFARSRIILNENLFRGLTMRIFQGMAAGSVVLTEESSSDSYAILEPENKILQYNPRNLAPLLDNVLRNKKLADLLGGNARQACRNRHGSVARAEELLSAVSKKSAFNPHGSEQRRFCLETFGNIRHILRFGGDLGAEVRNLKKIIAADDEFSPKASIELGRICAMHGDMSKAEAYLRTALGQTADPEGLLALSLFELRAGGLQKAEEAYAMAVAGDAAEDGIKDGEADRRRGLYMKIADWFYKHGRDFDFGYNKALADPLPGTAFEIGRMLWQEKPEANAITLMLKCLASYGIQGQLLPELRTGAEAGILNRELLQEAEKIAIGYYDFDLAQYFNKEGCRTKA